MGKTHWIFEGNSYKLARVTIKSVGEISYISVGESNKITKVEDIGQVADTKITRIVEE